MLIRNKTKEHVYCPAINKGIRPYRTVEVPDGSKIDKNKFEIIGESNTAEEVNYDLNGDGKVDKKDKSIAGKLLRKKLK